MRELIANLIEGIFGLYHDDYSQVLYYGNQAAVATGIPEPFSGYVVTGLAIIIIPLLFMFIFYRGTDLVHGKLWHWVVAFLITLLVVLITCMGIARLELVEFIVDPGNNPHINAFIFEYGIVSMLISIIPAFAGILFKFISINNKYNPF